MNSIVSRTSFDPTTGGRTTTYENVNGVWNARLMAMLSQPLRNKAFQVSLHTFGMYNRRVLCFFSNNPFIINLCFVA